jgi:hypothetical protein
MREYLADCPAGSVAGGNPGAYKQYDKKKRLDCRYRRRINYKNQY